MRKIRIKNNISLVWQIEKKDGIFDLSGHELSLWLCNQYTDDISLTNFTVTKNVVTFLFAGDKQRYTGVYSLKLQDTTDGFSTIDTDAFELVTRSALADGGDSEGITTETVQLTSEMQMAVKGDKGDTGVQGIKGDTGAQGIKGETGEQGLKGDTGAQGPKGDTGAQGIKGETGEQGLKGDTGEQGLKGDTGEQGLKGDVGAQGLKGEKGDKGAAFTYSDFTQSQLVELQKPAIDAAASAASQTEKCKAATDAATKAETEIEAAESIRKAAELERDATEQQRKTAELERDTDFTKIKSDVETALQQTSAACQKIDDKIDTFDKLTTGKVIITLSSNQVADSLLGKKIYIMNSSDNTALYVLEWQGITLVQAVADGTTFYVIAEETSNYKTPRTVAYTAVAGATYDISLQYECELLTMIASVESDPDPSGINVVVNGTSYVFDANNKIEIKIPFGTKYRILPGYSFGKITPATEYRTASVASYNKTLSYKAGALGVCIAMLDGTTRAIAGFDTSELDNAVGVAVITERTHVVVRSFSLPSSTYGGTNVLYGASDFNDGYGNTDILRKAGANLAIMADRCVYKNGRTPYIPAVNQFQDLVTNYTQLAAGLQLFGETLNVKSGYWWTSTEYNVSNAWYFDNGGQNTSSKSYLPFGGAPVVDF